MSAPLHRTSVVSKEWKSVSRPVYPPPPATYEEVVQSPELFFEKLKLYHRSLGHEFVRPIVGGDALDVHRLFVEVASRGGIETVIKNRRWREVVANFKFPASVTSASFVLRKFYLSLLYHFEQIYAVHKQIPTGSRPETAISNSVEEGTEAVHRGASLTGSIDGKFENGYLITVSAGGELHRGVLYHPYPARESSSQAADVRGSGRRMRKSRLQLRDEGFEYEDWQLTE